MAGPSETPRDRVAHASVLDRITPGEWAGASGDLNALTELASAKRREAGLPPSERQVRANWRVPALGIGVLLLVGGLMWFFTASQRHARAFGPERMLESEYQAERNDALDHMYLSGVPVAVGAALIAMALHRTSAQPTPPD